MFSLKRFFSLAMIAPLALSAGAAALFAQEEPDDYADYGEGAGLVVTAGRTAEDHARVPAQVTVITAEDIAASGASSVSEVLETVPGVRFSGGMTGPGSEAISMRGFGENSFGRVLVLVDGAKLNNPDMANINWNAVSLADIERIEILDGSASVQYGNSAVGGVVNIITKKGGKQRTLIDLSGGSFFQNKESIAHFQPLSWGNFSLSAEHSGTKGWRERQEAQTTNVTGGANINIGETMILSLNGFFSDLYYQLPGGLTKAQFEDDPKQALADPSGLGTYSFNGDDENTERHFGGGLGWQWLPSENLEVKLPLSYRGKLIKSDMASYRQYAGVVDIGGTYTGRRVHSFEARPQGAYTLTFGDMSLRLLGGVDVRYDEINADIYSDANYATKTRSYSITEWTAGPYLTARFSPLSNFSFQAGARFDTAIIHGENRNGSADGNKTYNAFVYDAGIAFLPVESLKLYAKYASLFRYPFVDELAQVAGFADKFNDGLEPERGFNAEAGASYRFGKMLDINVNFFFMRLEDEIAWVDGPGYSINANQNLDKTRHLGLNAGLAFSPFEWVSLDASYSFVNAIFIDGDNKDKKIPLVPEHKLYASLLIHLPFGLSFGPDIEYLSARYYGQDFGNEAGAMDAYILLGLRARFVLDVDKGRLAVQLTAKNLLDTHYAAYGTTKFDAYVANAWVYTLNPADGRSITVSASYRF